MGRIAVAMRRWGELFGAKFDVLLYDLTSTYFETDEDRESDDLRQFGCSRDKRGDCRQVVIALIVTTEGLPLSYEVMGGGTADSTALSGFLDHIEHRYGRANRIWVMDRGIPTEDSLAKMRTMGASSRNSSSVTLRPSSIEARMTGASALAADVTSSPASRAERRGCA